MAAFDQLPMEHRRVLQQLVPHRAKSRLVLVDELGVSETHVHNVLRDLVNAGWVEKEIIDNANAQSTAGVGYKLSATAASQVPKKEEQKK